jgi:hypothetical protein
MGSNLVDHNATALGLAGYALAISTVAMFKNLEILTAEELTDFFDNTLSAIEGLDLDIESVNLARRLLEKASDSVLSPR